MAEEKRNTEAEEKIRNQDRQEEDWQPGTTISTDTETAGSDVDVSSLSDLFHDLTFPAGKAEVLQRVRMGRTFHLKGPGDKVTRVELNRLVVQLDRSHFRSEDELLEDIREAVRKELHPDRNPG